MPQNPNPQQGEAQGHSPAQSLLVPSSDSDHCWGFPECQGEGWVLGQPCLILRMSCQDRFLYLPEEEADPEH